MFEEDDLVPISALQHFLFCDRQAALIHLEQVWVDNALTVEGTHLHESVDSRVPELKRGTLIRRGVTLRSLQLGVTGRADVVEFHPSPGGPSGIRLAGEDGLWKAVPVEYKRGRPKAHRADEVQLCAQAICLEEEFATEIDSGALFYWRTRRRQGVRFDQDLRALTEATARSVQRMFAEWRIPVRSRMAKCKHCSLVEVCLPRGRMQSRSSRSYLNGIVADLTPDPEAL
jgi:CRISPR-associated exonuclease Cas4